MKEHEMDNLKHPKAKRMVRHIFKLIQRFPQGGVSYGDLFEDNIDERTLMRDLADLKESAEELGWAFTTPGPGRSSNGGEKKYHLDLPFLPEPDEKRILLNILMMERLQKKTVLKANNDIDESLNLFLQILRYKNMTEYIGKMRDRIFFMEPRVNNTTEMVWRLDRCMDALYLTKEMEFTYNDRKRRVQALGLICKEERWYLLALCCQKKGRRMFRLDRMRNLIISNEKYEYPVDFSIKETMKHAWSTHLDVKEELINVRLHAKGMAAEELINMIFHPSQKLEKKEDSTVEVTFILETWEGMLGWILRWGYLVEVLEPEALRQKIKSIAEDIVRLY